MYVIHLSILYLPLDPTNGVRPTSSTSSFVGDVSSFSPTNREPATAQDPLGSLISGASAFGTWFSKTAHAKAPELMEKTKVAFSKTKTVTLEAYDKASIAAKKAGVVVEEFIDMFIWLF